MMCSLLQWFLLGSTCLISFLAVLSQTHPPENNPIHPPTHYLHNVDTYHNSRSSFGTSSLANKLLIKKLPNAISFNYKPNTYLSPYRVSKYYVEDSHKLMPIFESSITKIQSFKTASDIPGSSSGIQPFVSNKVHKLQDISTKGSSRSLEATNLTRSLTSRVKRNVGDAPPKITTLAAAEVAASSPTNTSNEVEDTNDIKDLKPTLVVTRGAVLRGFIVFVGCSVIVMVYFVLKFVCSRRQRRYSKVSRADDFDLLPLTEDGDDDEEIFSVNRRS